MSESNKNTADIGQQSDAALQRLEYIEQMAKGLLARVEMERAGTDPDQDRVIGTVDIDQYAMEIFLAAARSFDTDPTEHLLAWLRESFTGCDVTDTSQIPAWILPALKSQYVEDADFTETMLRDCLMRAVRQKPREFYHYCVATDPEENLHESSWAGFDLIDPNEGENRVSLRIPINMPIDEAVGAIENALDWARKVRNWNGGGDLKFSDIPPF